MSTKYKKLKNNALTKAKQTRTEQVNAKAKKYNKKISKSDEAYINGNIRQASAMRAYGIKQARAKGEEVYGYSKDDVYKARKNQLTVGKEINKDKAKYLYTNKETTVPGGTREDGSTYDSFTSRKRMLTDDEKTSLSKYGDLYDKNKELKQYKWMDSSKKDAKNLLEHMNTFRMDGMKTAKARAREEKGLGKLKEYGTGLAKDILIDPLVDTLRVADTVGGSLTGAGLGALENLDNLMKGYELDKDLISNNFKSSIKSSNETGWSKSSSEVLREREERQFLKDKEYYNNDEIMKKMYGTSDLEQHKKNIEKGTKYAGFIWDIIGDPTDIVNVVGKNLLKNTAKSGKELLTGTADISTAFKSKHLDDIFFSSKPYEDLKIFDDSGAGKIHSQLDNAYDRSVANDVREKVVQKVSTSSQKPFLASFLDELNNNSLLEGKQLKIDGRTLNKKYTQLKNSVKPYKIQEVNPSFNNPNKYVQEKQYDMFSKDYQNNLDEAYEEGLRKYEDFLDDDLTTDKMTDDMYDYLENNHPNYYKNLTGESDVIQEHIGNNKEVKWLSDNYTKQYENIEKKAKKERKFNAKKNEELEVENAVEQLLNIFDKKKTKVKNSKIRKFEFSSNIKDLSDKIVKGEFTNDDISQITKKLKGDSITKEVKRQQVNNLLFGGKEVLTKNVTSKNIDELLTSIEEIVSMKNAKDWYNETGEITKFKLSASTRKMLDIPNNKKVTVEDLDVDKLVQLLNNKSRSYTDNRYYEKLELLARVHEYDKIENVRNRVKEIDKEFKILDKKPLSQEVIKAKTDLSKERKLLKKKIDDRDKHWKQIRDLTENDFDKYISENYNQHMKGMNPYKHNTSKYKEIKNMDNLDGYKEALDETSIDVANKLYGDKDKLKKYEDMYDKNYASKFRTQMQEKLDLKYVKLDENSIPKNAKKDYKTLTKTRGTKEAISNIKKLLSEELDLRLNGKTKEASILREDIKFYTNKIRKAGVDDFYWFDEMKKFKSNLIKQAQKSATPSNPLEKLGVTINGKTYGKDLTADELQFQFLRSQGAKSLDELFDLDLPDVARAGDNTGNEIGNMLRVNNTPKETPLTKFRPQSKLPDPKYKLTKDKDLINLETGETKPFFDRHTTQEEYNEKIHGGYKQKNIEEYERLQKYVDNPDKYGIYDVMNLMDSMNIKFDPNDAESMDKALNKFFWIIEKKGIVPSNMKNVPQPNKSVKDMRNLPTNELKQLSDETKELVDNPMSLVENRALQDRNRDEIIDNARKMYERQDKESLFDRLFQQVDTKEKMKGVKPLFEQVDEYVNSSEGLKQYYTNLAKNDEVIKQLELANKGINPNAKPNKSVFDKLNKNQYSKQVNKDIDKLTKDRAELKNIDKLIGERITPQMVEEVGNKISKSLDDIKIDGDPITPEIRSEMTKEIHKYIDETLSRYSREEQEAIYEGLFQKLETIETNKNRKPIYEEVDDYLNSLEGLNKYYSNQEINSNVIKKLNLANKGIDVNKATTNKTILDKMAKQMNKHQFDPKTKRNYEEVVRQAIERGDIDERIAERLTSEMLEKVSNSKVNWGDIKTKRELDIEKQIESTKKIHSKIDELNEQYKTDDFGVVKEKKNFFDKVFNKNKSIDKPVVEDDLNTQSLGKMIEDDVEKFSKEIKEKNNFFKKMFQENNGEKLGYEDNEIYNVYKRWLNSYKKGHTVYNPGWHVQNYFQNKGQNYLALGMDAFAPQTKAKNLLHEIKGKSNKAQDSYGKYSKNEIIDFIKQNGVVDGLGEDVISSNGIFPKLETSIDNSDFMKKLGESEQTARLHHFLTQLERGKSMEESLKSVNDTLFDYSKKTNLDKVISDFVDPFWVFHKNNAKLIGKSAIKNSDKFSRLDRGLRNLGKPGEDGKRGTGHKFVDDVNKDEYEYRYKQQILPDARESLSISDGDIENKLNPLLQLAMKHSKGEGNFGNKIVDGEANWGEITKDEAIKEALLDVNPFMPQLVKFINNATDKKDRAESGKQSEETSNKQILHDFITFITGNKGNYYRQY